LRKHVAAAGRLAVLSGALGSLVAIGAPHAQPVYVAPGYVAPGSGYGEPGLPAYAIMSIVRSTGLTPLTRPMRRGSNYVLVAIDRSGRQMRLVVDARRGAILNMRPAVAAAPPYYGPYPGPYGAVPSGAPAYGAPLYGAAPPYGQAAAPIEPPVTAAPPAEAPLALPPAPRSIPHAANDAAAPTPRANTKLANAPTGIVSIPDPPAPPLPRPRPALASSGTSLAPVITPPANAVQTAAPVARPPMGPADPAQIE
jgi:hypothetical protein